LSRTVSRRPLDRLSRQARQNGSIETKQTLARQRLASAAGSAFFSAIFFRISANCAERFFIFSEALRAPGEVISADERVRRRACAGVDRGADRAHRNVDEALARRPEGGRICLRCSQRLHAALEPDGIVRPYPKLVRRHHHLDPAIELSLGRGGGQQMGADPATHDSRRRQLQAGKAEGRAHVARRREAGVDGGLRRLRVPIHLLSPSSRRNAQQRSNKKDLPHLTLPKAPALWPSRL